MDNLTHTLTALVLARSGLSRLAPYATPALLVAANVADIDYLCFLGGARTYLEYHQGWSHSLAGAAVLGTGVALAFWSRARLRSSSSAGQAERPHLLRNLLLVCLVGALSHSLLDWMSTEGAAWGWPVKQSSYALDWFPFVDLWLLVILLLGLAVPSLFRLIGEEIGARPSDRGLRRGAYAALVACAVLVGVRASLHADGVAQLESRLYRDRSPVRVAAFPLPLNPFRWTGVVETDTTYEIAELILVGSRRGLEPSATYYKPSASPALTAALGSRSAQIFLSWARFPYIVVNPSGGGWRIRITDLRTTADAHRARLFVVWVDVNQQWEVVEEILRYGRLEDEPPS